MFYYMSLCINIPFLTASLEMLHRFASNFVWMYPYQGATPFFMELWVILCNFWPILKKSSIKPQTRNHSYLVWIFPRQPSL